MTVLWWSLAAVASTLAGGLVALGVREHLRLVVPVVAAALLAFVGLELVPESIEWARLSGAGITPFAAAAAGLSVFALAQGLELRGWLAAGALIGHSFLDGVGLGLAFQLSPALGLAVATMIVAHDFVDGLNTVGLMLAHRNTTAHALGMLALDALAPLAGAASTLVWQFPPVAMAAYLGFFAGVLSSIALLWCRILRPAPVSVGIAFASVALRWSSHLARRTSCSSSRPRSSPSGARRVG